MTPHKPQKTVADFMVAALSPVLIMALVGSLCFFLIEVFYRGRMAGGVRWVMFWFVVATVLVARIAIEKTSEYAALYGLALAGAVWIYLVRTQPAYLAGILLLAVVWLCAHKLVWDCTFIDEDEDASGRGLLQSPPPAAMPAGDKSKSKPKLKRKRAASSSPGLWVVYFSLAALPLFGFGQVLLPADAAGARRTGLGFLVLYMAAALGLLVTTSFLGLRRYLRQRYLRMPAVIALAWLKLGAGLALVILAAALFLPRPGANQAWTALRYQIDYRLRQASQYATRSNPHGQGEGRAGGETSAKEHEGKSPGPSASKSGPSDASDRSDSSTQSSMTTPGAPPGQAGSVYHFLRAALWVAAVVAGGWWLFRCRHLLLEMARSLTEAIRNFIRNMIDIIPARRPARPGEPAPPGRRIRPLAEYKNPFYAGKEHTRPPAEIILYTYEAVQAWAREQGIEPHPEQTAREFCGEMAARAPELAAPYRQLSFLYAHAAYGARLPADCDLEPLKELWRRLTWGQAGVPARP
jgi:hypothetical protein